MLQASGSLYAEEQILRHCSYADINWDSFKQFVLEHEVLDLFEKRIAQGNMKQFLEENPGVVPPGLNSDSEVTITVRKPTK